MIFNFEFSNIFWHSLCLSHKYNFHAPTILAKNGITQALILNVDRLVFLGKMYNQLKEKYSAEDWGYQSHVNKLN